MSTRYTYPNKETRHALQKILRKLLKPGKGILVADEGPHTMGKRLKEIGVKNTEENRREYRQILFCLDPEKNTAISGAVMHHEATKQRVDCGMYFPEFLTNNGLTAGVRINRGQAKIYGTYNEKVAEGLDNLEHRIRKYREKGIQFTKFRNALQISRFTPSPQAIHEGAEALARFASISQANCVLPVLQPVVLRNGDHDIKGSQRVTETYLSAIIRALQTHHVSLENIILNPSMVTPGRKCKDKNCKTEQIAQRTVSTIIRVVPPAVPGILFSSNGMTEEEATVALNHIVVCCKAVHPWRISFGYGSALQQSAMQTWAGRQENIERAQSELIRRANANSQASLGKYKEGSVKGATSNKDIFCKCHEH